MSAAAVALPAAGGVTSPRRLGPGFWFVAPAVALLVLVGLLPFLWSVVVSFLNLTGSNRTGSFIGFDNYVKLVQDPRLLTALGRTLLILIVALPLELILGLLLAFHFQADRPLKRIFVALLVLPAVVSPMVAGSMWRLMFDQKFGPVNQIISWFTEKPVVLLWTIKGTLPFWSIIIAEVWQWTPFMFVILLAALANVDRDQIDAASLDGAGRWQTFWKIILPAIKPVLVIALLIRGLDLFRIFDAVWQLTRGGPGSKTETISIYMYIKGFQGFETSYIAAVVVLLAIVLTWLVMQALRRVELAR
ncbi:MAG: sugar ABC transporter permease [Geminicoccaceae bacterium]